MFALLVSMKFTRFRTKDKSVHFHQILFCQLPDITKLANCFYFHHYTATFISDFGLYLPKSSQCDIYLCSTIHLFVATVTNGFLPRNLGNTKKAPRRVPCYKAKLAPFLDLNEAGLPRVYSVYREFLNPTQR